MLDTRIVGGTVVDGTGRPGEKRTVAIRDGIIVPDDGGEPRRTIDAHGLVVSPGFVDVHTHYDAQVFWDPALTPSPLHGVTTAVAGNCGFSLAPGGPTDLEYLIRLLARVEGMSLGALEAGVPRAWCTTAEYLDVIEGRGIGVNIGFLTGHSAIRRYVMGERSVGERATAADIRAMCVVLRDAVAGGSLGFSTSFAPTHADGDLRPVPSRWAGDDEILALASALQGTSATCLEIVPQSAGKFEDEEVRRMIGMSLAADLPLNWNVLIVGLYDPALYDNRLAASDSAAERGACVKGLVRPDPTVLTMSFATGMMLEALSDDWHALFRRPIEARIAALLDPAVRRKLDVSGGPMGKLTRWADYTIECTTSPSNDGLAGRKVGDVARELGRSPFDTVLDIVVEDRLTTGLSAPVDDGGDQSWQARKRLCADHRMVVGGSDAGGHVDIMCGAVYTTKMLSEFRERGLMATEEIVHLLTDVPARFLGLRGRGRIVEGMYADVVVFDPDRVIAEPLHVRRDLPDGTARLFGGSNGIVHVLVNGEPIVVEGDLTQARAGTVLRSGRDTVSMDNTRGLALRRAAQTT